MLKAIDKISKKDEEVYKLLSEPKKIDKKVDNVELICTKTDGTKYDFNRFSFPLKLFEKIYSLKITLDEAIEKQAELKELINKLNDYGPRIINLFEKGTFSYKGNVFRTKEEESEEEPEEESEEKKLEKINGDYKFFFKYIEDVSKSC